MKIKINQHNNKISFLESTPNHDSEIKPLFFYHTPKTGGLSFANSLTCAATSAFSRIKREVNPSFIEPITARIDEKFLINNPNSRPFNFVCGHVKWGWHKRCETDFFFSTIIRSPITRVLSAYNYRCMRQRSIPNCEEFIRFFRNKDNQNVNCKLLNPDIENNVEHVTGRRVFEHLCKTFHSFITPSSINELLSYYLSLYGFPNVITERVNVTLPKYKLDGSEFYDELAELNEEDLVLYDLVNNNSRLPKLKLNDDSISDRTIVLNETEKELRSIIAMSEISTSKFFDQMDVNAKQMASIENILRLVASV